jgi:hypothetical protein
MSGSHLAQWLIPIVVAVALFSWLGAVLYADAHPRYKHQSRLPRYEVTGGAFEANDGGRQLMPIPGGRPMADRPYHADSAASAQIPGQRTAPSYASSSASSSAAGPGAGQAAEGKRAVPGQRRADEPHLIAGSKLR